MDAVEFIKGRKRMCESYDSCLNCPVNDLSANCEEYLDDDPECFVEIVGKWVEDHPIKTRQSEFLKIFPDAKILNGTISICPKHMDRTLDIKCQEHCDNCRNDYWLAEIE